MCYLLFVGDEWIPGRCLDGVWRDGARRGARDNGGHLWRSDSGVDERGRGGEKMGRREGIMWTGSSRKDSKLVVKSVCTPRASGPPNMKTYSLERFWKCDTFFSILCYRMIIPKWEQKCDYCHDQQDEHCHDRQKCESLLFVCSS